MFSDTGIDVSGLGYRASMMSRSQQAVSPNRTGATVGTTAVYFGQGSAVQHKKTFVIPPGSIILSIAGLFGPRSNVEGLTDYFNRAGHSAYAIENPFIRRGQSIHHASNWLVDKIDDVRITHAQQNLKGILKSIALSRHPVQTVIDHFSLSNSHSGERIASLILTFLRDKEMTDRLLNLKPYNANSSTNSKPYHDRLTTVLNGLLLRIQHQLPYYYTLSQREKIAYKLLDVIAPRVVLVGHSKGGVTSMVTLLRNRVDWQGTHPNDIGMVITLGSPINGTKDVPDSFNQYALTFDPLGINKAMEKQVESMLPSVSQMRKGSSLVSLIQNSPLPYDSSAIAIANPKDGLVGVDDATLNTKVEGTLNLKVTPRETSPLDIAPREEQFWMNLTFPGQVYRDWLKNSKTHEGIRNHCGLVDHHQQYWSERGEMLSLLFDGEEAAERLKRLLVDGNYEPLREQVLQILIEKTEQEPQRWKRYQALVPILDHMTLNRLPFANSTDALAQRLLKHYYIHQFRL